MKKILIIILLIWAAPAHAGDYMLYISDNYYADCMKKARKFHAWCNENKKHGGNCDIESFRPIKTAEEVSDSLIQYFEGQEPKIKFLQVAFENGHLKFCGSKEVDEIYETLVNIKKRGAFSNKKRLDDFIMKIEKLR